MAAKNLEPGQFQIGNLVMGEWTLYKIESIDIGNYDVNVQDSQASQASTIRFGQDSLKPSPMQLTINVLKNKMMENVVALTGSTKVLNFDNDPGLHELQEEWRAEDVMEEWGKTKPLYFCGSDGITRQFFGRPGKFGYKLHKINGSAFYQCQAEFRRLDTFGHSETEWFIIFNPGAPQTITLTRPTAPSWPKFWIYGPADHPVITFGPMVFELDWNIVAGKIVEISTYPWQQRIVDSDGLSLAAYLISDRPYLDKIKFPAKTPYEISWTATGTTSASKMVLFWHDAYQVLD